MFPLALRTLNIIIQIQLLTRDENFVYMSLKERWRNPKSTRTEFEVGRLHLHMGIVSCLLAAGAHGQGEGSCGQT